MGVHELLAKPPRRGSLCPLHPQPLPLPLPADLTLLAARSPAPRVSATDVIAAGTG